MEKKAQLYEIIIKLALAIFSFIAAIFVVKNVISLFPLLKTPSMDQALIYKVIYGSLLGDILNDIGIVNKVNFAVLLRGFVAFLANVDWICIFYFLLLVALLSLYFIFNKWSLVRQYSKLLLTLGITFILKYLFFVIFVFSIYQNTMSSLASSLVVATISFMVFSFIELTILSLFIIKFIFNFLGDIKYYLSH